MRKLILFVHTSLDGFVAGLQGEMDWIHVDEAIFDHVGAKVSQSDTALYGRVTYQMMEAYWPTAADQANASKHDIEHAQWYGQATKVVLSRTMKDQQIPNTIIIGEHLSDEIRTLTQRPGSDILIFGSPSAAHSLMGEDLVDGFWLFVNPILLGKGIPLFAGVSGPQNLTLISSKTFASGIVALYYERLKS